MSFFPLKKDVALTDDFEKNVAVIKETCHTATNQDIICRPFSILNEEALLVFIDGMVQAEQISHYILKPCQQALPVPPHQSSADYLMHSILPVGSVKNVFHLNSALTSLFGGDSLLLWKKAAGVFTLDVKGYIRRSIAPPSNESVIAGSHEGFGETLKDNTVLMRRLLRTPDLICETFSIGHKIPKSVSMLYLNGIAEQENADELRRRLKGCNTDYVFSMGVLEQLLEDHPFALIPQAVYTERPDRACSFLLEGQLVLMMENSPYAMALPAGLMHLLHTPDDTSMRWQYGTFLRLLRLAGLGFSLILPAVYVALVTFHPQGIPVTLMTSILESQSKVPMTLFPSMMLMLLIFCLINEAGTRIPGVLGSSLSIVGGLILGQAAITANLFSPEVIIVVALSGLGSYAAPNYSVTIAIRLAQFFLLILSGYFGFLGFIGGLFLLLMRMMGLDSLNVPFLSPNAPHRPQNPDTVLRLPIWRQRLHSYLANPFQMLRTEGAMRKWDKERRK